MDGMARRRSSIVTAASPLLLAPTFVCLLDAGLLRADVLHLTGGDALTCEIVEDLGVAYRVRSLIGIVEIPKDRVVRIETRPSPWQQYERKQRACPNTAPAHYELAQWCKRQGLGTERLRELERVIALDPDHPEARKALGYIRDDRGGWVKKASAARAKRKALGAQRGKRDEERFLQRIVSEWFVKIQAIYRARLADSRFEIGADAFRKGREQILAIRDPLALPALTGVLSSGGVRTRRLLLEALAQFEEDEATMNLLVMTLFDPAATLREQAVRLLGRRPDPRVVSRLREALKSEEERVVRHAATALGILKAASSVEDLIRVLSTETRRPVRISRAVYLDGVVDTFGGPYAVRVGRGFTGSRTRGIGVLGPGSVIGTTTHVEVRSVANYRTEVQDALIAITGENFGFDRAAWLHWRRSQAPG